jgi:hypothetical protein
MSTPWHPFEFPYVGLGLLDEASIRREGDDWTAEYRADGEPYLALRVTPDLAQVVEIDEDGDRVATTTERTLVRALGLHAGSAVRGLPSRFWTRARSLAGWFDVWVDVSLPRAEFAFVPAFGLGRLSVPSALDVPWLAPEPGPIARRIGAVPFDEPDTMVRATMHRTFLRRPDVVSESIRLFTTTIPGILLPETIAALHEANGRHESVAWRPFVENQPVGPVARSWLAPESLKLEIGAPTTVAIVDDRVADQYDGNWMSLA